MGSDVDGREWAFGIVIAFSLIAMIALSLQTFIDNRELVRMELDRAIVVDDGFPLQPDEVVETVVYDSPFDDEMPNYDRRYYSCVRVWNGTDFAGDGSYAIHMMMSELGQDLCYSWGVCNQVWLDRNGSLCYYTELYDLVEVEYVRMES